VAVVSATTAKRFWTDGDAVGKHVRFVGENNWRTVVGIVADVKGYDHQNNEPTFMRGTAYVPYTTAASLEDGRLPAEMTIAVRTPGDSANTANLLRSTLAGLAPNIPITEVRTMHTVVSEAASSSASITLLFTSFASIALVLGIVGVYGVLSYLVSRRRREMGVRMALGAQRSDVLWLVMKEGAKFAATGIALGIGGAFVVARLLSSQLYGVSPMDAVTYITVSVVVAIVTLAACYIPARRAMAIDPIIALRYD
jgi:ABC-type antimicrobial peptide transport system permease subunit